MRTPTFLCLLLLLQACTKKTDPPPQDAGPENDAGPASVDAGPPDGRWGYSIDPVDPVVTVELGREAEVRFTVIETDLDSGAQRSVSASWELDSRGLGAMDSAGRFTTRGEVGGVGTVGAVVTGRDGGRRTLATDLTVRVRAERRLDGVPADVADRFNRAPAELGAQSATILYPLDGAVMPQNVFPATIQWQAGGVGDLYRIRLSTAHSEVTAYAADGPLFTRSWQVDEAAWHLVAQTDVAEDVTVDVDRLVGGRGQPIPTPPVHIRFAPGSVSGSVYFVHYTGSNHHLYRIDDGSDRLVDFMPEPPQHCVGCHAVSRDGRHLAGRLGGANNVGAVFDLLALPASGPAPTVYTPSTRWYRATWNPSGDRLLVDTVTQDLELVDPFSGAVLTAATGSLPSQAAYPSWAPDGHAVAYVSSVTESNRPGWEWIGNGDLSVLPVEGVDRFGQPRRVLDANAIAGGDTVSYPTWSADSQLIAFAHGASNYGVSEEQTLYATTEDGTRWVHLTRASAGPGTQLDSSPVFSPFCTGGYCWLAFTSLREYGNSLAGTRGRPQQQVWVTAVRQDEEIATLDGDPSHAAYWLPGQPLDGHNLYAQWAARACRADAEECGVDSECCSGLCRAGEDGTARCLPPEDQCREQGELCGGEGCCGDLTCVANVCQGGLI